MTNKPCDCPPHPDDDFDVWPGCIIKGWIWCGKCKQMFPVKPYHEGKEIE